MHGCRAAPTARASAGSTAAGGGCACARWFSSWVPLRVHAGPSEAKAKTKLSENRSETGEPNGRLPKEAPLAAVVVPFAFIQMARPPRETLFDREIRAAGDGRARDRARLHLVRREHDVRGQLSDVHLARLTRRRDRRDGAAPRKPCKRSHKHASCNQSPHRIIPFVNGWTTRTAPASYCTFCLDYPQIVHFETPRRRSRNTS